MVCIVACSDLHGFLPDIPTCDLLLLAGDLCPVYNHDVYFQKDWLNTKFRTWLQQVPAKKTVGIAGNHDFIFATNRQPKDLDWTYLQDSGAEYRGLKIYGTPWQSRFGNWPFMAEESELDGYWSRIPENTDILVVHGPPHGYGDLVQGNHQGSVSLAHHISRVQPKLVFFGHIHDNNGEYQLGSSRLFNVAIMNNNYEPIHKPIVLDVPSESEGQEKVFDIRKGKE